MPNSKNQVQRPLAANPFTKKRPWVKSTLVLVVVSVGGALGINFFWLNPVVDLGGTASDATKTQTVTGDAIEYRYGTVQLGITATNGKIETINEIQATATSGWEQAIPVLHDEALKAQKADFGNLSGATYVTEAYQQAFASAISKLK